MQQGDFVSINYVGRIKDTGEIFDLTDVEIAKKEKIYDEHIKYGPVTVVVDGGFLIKGLDEVLKEMKLNEKRKIDIGPEKAFGERRPDFVKLIPLSTFKQQNITPEKGSYVTINGIRGRVVSADGGRIRVDFNHPLAGKKIEYEIEIRNLVTETLEKIVSIVIYFTNIEKQKIEVLINNKEAEISLKESKEISSNLKKEIANAITKWVKEIERVKFIDVYSK